MKKLFLAFLAISMSVGVARGQVASSFTSQKHDLSFSLGREFWFAAQSNYWGQDLGGKYIRLYISSVKNTVAYVEYSGQRDTLPISAGKTTSFRLPESWELESSGVVENKGIHVYSKDADLSVYNLSRNAYTSDGEYVIPTIGWGTDYVVAAYGSLYEGSGTYVYDLPSTMAIVAAQDNTSIVVTPSCDCRQCTSGNISGDASSEIVVFPAGQPIPLQLNRGQCIELMPIKALDPENFDMTGTTVHSNVPVGVFGGSGCPNIPADRPYCDHVEDMVPPVRTWGKTYYATNPIQPAGSTDESARYLFISSKPGQTIFKYNCNQGATVECKIDAQYGIYWDELEHGQKFFSDKPFLAVEYINSATYPDGGTNKGDPAEAIVTPQEAFTQTVVFQTPQAIGNIVPYTNYANIIVNANDTNTVLFDGKKIKGISSSCLDSDWEVFTMSGISAGQHTVTGDDSGVGVWVYGYGFDESYAWSSSDFEGTFQSADTTPPVAVFLENCLNGHAVIRDSGMGASKLAAIHVDSATNMSVTLDSTFVEGIAQNSSFFDYSVIHADSSAYLLVTTYDFAGNSRTVTVSYEPNPFECSPSVLNFGVVPIGHQAQKLYDTISYNGLGSISIDSVWLANGTVGFHIDSSTTGTLDSGETRVVEISFTPSLKSFEADTLMIGSNCWSQGVTLKGSGINLSWSVDNEDWNRIPFESVAVTRPVTVHNYSTAQAIVITSATADSIEFAIDPTAFPLTVLSSSSAQFNVAFTPLYPGQSIASLLRAQSFQDGEQDAKLSAEVNNADGVSEPANATTSATFFSSDGTNIQATVPMNWPQPIHVEIENLLGVTVFESNLTIDTSASFDPGSLPRGVYFYRLTSGSKNQTGKIILGQ